MTEPEPRRSDSAVTARLALVGYGRIAPKHLEVFRALGAEIVASANRSAEGRAKAEREGNIPRTFTSAQEMIEAVRPDGVLVMPSFMQVSSAAREVLPFGLPTLLEKPPGTSVAELDELIALAQQHHTPAMVGLNRRHYGVVEQALQDAGGRAAITSATVEWSEDPHQVLKRLSPPAVERLIYGNSLHGLDMLTHFVGPIEAPQVLGRVLDGGPFRWIMALQGMGEHGAVASFTSTWDAPGKWRVGFTTRDRRYLFAPLETCTVQERGQPDRSLAPPDEDTRFKPGFHAQARRFLDAITSREVPTEHQLISARPAMALAEALTRALLGS